MNKMIGFAAALATATGLALATPSIGDAGYRGVHGCYVGGHHYNGHIWYGGRINYSCYTPIVPYYRSVCSPVVVPGCSYDYPRTICGNTPIPNTFGLTTQTAYDNTVQIHVLVPAAAKVWFNDSETQQVGTDRLFTSPPLTPGFDYTYDVKAQWIDQSGNQVTQVRQVTMRANAQVDVNFLQPAQ
jgi:uncharacterized protein (TIGR03000 family)